VNDGMISA